MSILAEIWLLILISCLLIYLLLDGFDLGVALCLGLSKKDPQNRQEIVETIRPFWDLNEVWLITFVGVLFAAFPRAYAFLLSHFYLLTLSSICALIIRGLSLELRPKAPRFTDTCLVLSSIWIICSFSLIFYQTVSELPLLALLENSPTPSPSLPSTTSVYNLASLLFNLTTLSALATYGALYLLYKLKTPNFAVLAHRSWLSTSILSLGVIYNLFRIHFTSWLFWSGLMIYVLSLASTKLCLNKQLYSRALGSFAVALGSSSLTLLLLSCEQTILPLMFSNSASNLSLAYMLGITLIFLPLVAIYTVWYYRLFKRPSN